jgi:hypothetical protein
MLQTTMTSPMMLLPYAVFILIGRLRNTGRRKRTKRELQSLVKTVIGQRRSKLCFWIQNLDQWRGWAHDRSSMCVCRLGDCDASESKEGKKQYRGDVTLAVGH